MATLRCSNEEICLNPYMEDLLPEDLCCFSPSLAYLACKRLLRCEFYKVNTLTGVVWIYRTDGFWHELKIWCKCGCKKWEDAIVVREEHDGVLSRIGTELITTVHMAEKHNNNTKEPKLLFF